MKSLLSILAAPLLLTACDAEVRTPANGDEKVALSADANGSVKFDMPFAKGNLKLPNAMMASGDFDIDGVTLPKGSRMTGFNLNAGDGNEARVDMSFIAPAPPAETGRYFLASFKDKGMQAAMSGGAIKGKTKDGSPFVMRLVPNGSGTRGTIELSTKS
ncbi:hypothetical protein GCM10022280_17260 [Sphingomonas swuensis]|uniref:Lipoprotein n=1 Tax=Sphingomonas swuensis TaxID=977800 RepID=A0ABP7SYN7_9SPHN